MYPSIAVCKTAVEATQRPTALSDSSSTLPDQNPADEATPPTSTIPLMVRVRSDLDGTWQLVQSTFGNAGTRVVALHIRGPRPSSEPELEQYGVSDNLLDTVAPSFEGILGWAGSDGCNGFRYHYDEERLLASGTLILCPDIVAFVGLFHRALESATSARVVDDRLVISAPIGVLTFERT